MAYRISMNSVQVRFDLTAMIQEWTGFLETQCGFDKADPALVAVLAFEQNLAFHEFVHEEGMCWDDITGEFVIPDLMWMQMVRAGGFPYSREAWDLVWSDCFENVKERLDEIEERVHQEREQGLV